MGWVAFRDTAIGVAVNIGISVFKRYAPETVRLVMDAAQQAELAPKGTKWDKASEIIKEGLKDIGEGLSKQMLDLLLQLIVVKYFPSES